MEESQINIVVVDDTPAALKVLEMMLKMEGYNVRGFSEGKAALESIEEFLPDLILLDISMPEMTGYEVCEKLKASAKTKDIPVIFLTSLSETEDELKGFEVGAVDFILKPMKVPIVRARVKLHLELVQSRKQIQKQNQELMVASKLKEDVDRITKHDLKNPVTVIVGLYEMLIQNPHLSEDERRYLKLIETAGYDILNIVNMSLDLYKMENNTYLYNPENIDLLPILQRIIEGFSPVTTRLGINIKLYLNGNLATAQDKLMFLGEGFLCYSLFSNIIKNAMEASPKNEMIEIFCSKLSSGIQIEIINSGEVPKEIRANFFDKYVTCGKSKGTGLGTYSARLITQTQGGSIVLNTSLPGKTKLCICLPAQS